MSVRLPQVWAETVARQPDARALVDGATGRVWTRAELARESATWRAQVAAVETLRGCRVVLTEPNGIGWWRVFLGLVEAGAVPVALDAAEPCEQQVAVANAIGASWIWRNGMLEPTQSRRIERRRNVCLYKLTSGSTGMPKAIAFTHDQMLADGRQICASMDIGPDDLNLAVIPLGHSYGLGNLVMPLLAQGTALVAAASPLPQAIAADCARWRPTVFPAVPALLNALARADVATESLRSLRIVISAGAVLPADVAARFADKFHRPVHGFYGASETGGIAYDRDGEATGAGRSVGRPLEGVTLAFRPRGRFVVTSAAVTGRGSFAPPDRGELNALGELVLRGRAGRIVKIAARRVDLGEIEHGLRSIAGVREAYAMPHPHRPEALAAAVIADQPASAIKAQLREKLSAWKIPDRLVVLPEFPLTARGKTDTRRLRALLGGSEAEAPVGSGDRP